MLIYMQRFIRGVFRATIHSAFVKSLRMLSAAVLNFCFSYSSREKPFTTRMPRTFSSIDSFNRSYFLNTLRKAGMAFLPMARRPKARMGITTTKTNANLPPMTNAMTVEKIRSSGLLMAMRINIINAICTLVTSVVIRVTREDDENLSMFSKE